MFFLEPSLKFELCPRLQPIGLFSANCYQTKSSWVSNAVSHLYVRLISVFFLLDNPHVDLVLTSTSCPILLALCQKNSSEGHLSNLGPCVFPSPSFCLSLLKCISTQDLSVGLLLLFLPFSSHHHQSNPSGVFSYRLAWG